MTGSTTEEAPSWWSKPRRVAVVVDNPSWVLPYAQELVDMIKNQGDDAALYRAYEDIPDGAIAFFLGCVKIAPAQVIARNHRTLVVHASPLPKGRGFSPLTWMILDGCKEIPVCLLNAEEGVDTGAVVYRDSLRYEGHELIDELREVLGLATIDLCRRFLAEPLPPAGEPQTGEPSYYERRRPADSALDPGKSLEAQFNLLRVVDNEKYPAFFDLQGHRYIVSIRKETDTEHD